jgi:hypothetical protein
MPNTTPPTRSRRRLLGAATTVAVALALALVAFPISPALAAPSTPVTTTNQYSYVNWNCGYRGHGVS